MSFHNDNSIMRKSHNLPRRERRKRTRRIMVTFNNPADHNWEEVKQHLVTLYYQEKIRYLAISSLEVGEEGTPHYHALILLPQQVDFHILQQEYIKGYGDITNINSTKDANHYVLKPNYETNGDICPCDHCQKQYELQPERVNAPEIYGVITHQGLKEQLVTMKAEIDSGEDDLSYHLANHPIAMARHINYYKLCLFAASEQHAYSRYHRIQEAYEAEELDEVLRLKPVIEVLWGPSGTGKTKSVYSGHRDRVCRPQMTGRRVWFDGLKPSTQICVLDDYYGQTSLDWLLTFLDVYPHPQEFKGGMIYPVFDRIYITSNVHPDFWWRKSRHLFPQDKLDALMRRLTEGNNAIRFMSGDRIGQLVVQNGRIVRRDRHGVVTEIDAEVYVYNRQKEEYRIVLDEIQGRYNRPYK
jgi:hypothetical protein